MNGVESKQMRVVIDASGDIPKAEDSCLLPMDEALKKASINPDSLRRRYKTDGVLFNLEQYYEALHLALVHTDDSALNSFNDDVIEGLRHKIGPRAFDALTKGARIRAPKIE